MTAPASPHVALPRLVVVADAASAPRPLPEIVGAAAEFGARAFVLRARELPSRERAALVMSLRTILPADSLVIVAGGYAPAMHLSSTEPFPAPRPSLVGRSCHDASEVDRASLDGCDYVFVSPVYETASKPGYGPPLGPDGLAALCRPGMPVFALGGVLPHLVTECRKAGAYGVAVMGPVLRDPSVVADYLSALKEAL